ncbi:hypothetical protein P7C73_g419, partial [Tremellales sp. Uapishka_1]
MSLRKDNEEKGESSTRPRSPADRSPSPASETLTPDFFKSDGEKAKEGGENIVDKGLSYLPGQSKARDAFDSNAKNPNITHDTGRQGPSGIVDALKPSGDQSSESKLKQETNKVGSLVEPEKNKSFVQEATDFFTPGNKSAADGKGVADHLADAAAGAKNTVAGLFSSEEKKE